MAQVKQVTKEVLKRTLSINVEDGVTASGAVKTKTHNYSGIKAEAADENILAAGNALGGLMATPVQVVVLTDKASLEEAA